MKQAAAWCLRISVRLPDTGPGLARSGLSDLAAGGCLSSPSLLFCVTRPVKKQWGAEAWGP